MSDKLNISEKVEKAVFEEFGFGHNAGNELKELLASATEIVEGYHEEMGSHVSLEINKYLFELNFDCDTQKINLDEFCFNFAQAKVIINAQVLSGKKTAFPKEEKEKLCRDFEKNKKNVLDMVLRVKKVVVDIKEFLNKRK
ncbi:MAG: hypothetical protein J7K00_04680 [Candidatus Diapherotrites archaeon]|nr:hypothetical protein [Candidatus Diapherotrites archaeon]